MIIAIDGLAGAGKTTVGLLLAEKLSVKFVSSGCLYRCIAKKCIDIGLEISSKNIEAIEQIAKTINIEFVVTKNEENNMPSLLVFLDGVDVSGIIKSEEVSAATTKVAQLDKLRVEIRKLQKTLSYPSAVVEGRDIGTVVFPNAFLKIYLRATEETRALRRTVELDGKTDRLDLIKAKLAERDQTDVSRTFSPLKKAEDAIIIDTDFLTPKEAVDIINNIINDRQAN